MPTAVDAHLTEPVPGVPVVSRLGNLLAVVHDGFPGVLLGVRDMGSDLAWIERCDVERPDEWQRVRSGGPVWLSAGGGSAYDLEAEYGRTYVYRLSVLDPTDFQMLVRMPQYRSCDAFLKHLGAPHLSTRVRVMVPWEPVEATWMTVQGVYGSGRIATDGFATQGITGEMTLRTYGEDDWRRLSRALSTPGVMLLQSSPDHGLDPLYFVRGDIGHGRPGSIPGYGLRDFSFAAVQVDRPSVTDVPPVIPGWTWDHAVSGRSFDQVDALYADEWSMLLDGVQRWEPPRVGPS